MRARHAKARATASDIERQTARLLRALAEPGASARTTDIPRPGLLAVSAKRRGVSLASGHFPAAAGAHLVAQDLARWRETPGRPVLEITAAGHAKLKRGAAPEPEQFQAQHREVEEAVIEPHGRVKRNEAESPLVWLRRRGKDGAAAHAVAGKSASGRASAPRFRSRPHAAARHLALGRHAGRRRGAGPQAGPMTDLSLAARQRVDAAHAGGGPGVFRPADRCLRLPERAGDLSSPSANGRAGRRIVLDLALGRLARALRDWTAGQRPPRRPCAIGARRITGRSLRLNGRRAPRARRRRASALMRSTIERTPFERCGVRCCAKPSFSNSAAASISTISLRRLAGIERQRQRHEPAHDMRVAVAAKVRTRLAVGLVRSTLVSSQTWLAQPRTLLASLCAASGSGSSVRPSSMR